MTQSLFFWAHCFSFFCFYLFTVWCCAIVGWTAECALARSLAHSQTNNWGFINRASRKILCIFCPSYCTIFFIFWFLVFVNTMKLTKHFEWHFDYYYDCGFMCTCMGTHMRVHEIAWQSNLFNFQHEYSMKVVIQVESVLCSVLFF